MSPDEAALCLRDDPTFATSSREDQETEAALLLGTDDPLDIAMAIELALAAPPAPVTTTGARGEPCRLETPCGRPRLAGNGRCLDCGAQREAAVEQPASAPMTPKTAAKRSSDAEAAKLRRGVTHDPEASLLGRFKEATGATDSEMAAMLDISRASVQAYIAGRRTELLSDDQARTLIDGLAERLLLLAGLKRDLAIAIGEIDPD
jgi:hypothetical protein